ncbi:putative RNA polymerase II subunit B1 CTD phosphatase RPAP2 [Leguminivora glycinivorella]|uniref:putative RNA polymerase II subunit B1 CTD phosphatase RPAP2 n=1 Tax=Leguminivora glycinivorella TaxID=1035111 RepID=UPI00200BEE45|nr:putative RNA polymerase II subunit B1 CTD phosphatase RPAP2 [Leguminivora glycinivorella]
MESPAAKPKKKPTKIDEMTKEEVRQAILKKRECNAKAQTIVENLLETNISETYLMECLPDINQSHFEDIIEERSILHVCGYPLCDKPISEKDIPKQKYRISVKTNKVYDITGRKSFCSNHCYNSAMHVKKQMLTSPLWFREYEVIPKFCLLPLDSVGSMGQEIDVSIIEKVKTVERPAFTSINDFAKASLQEIGGNQGKDNDEPEKKQLETETEVKNSIENTNNVNEKSGSSTTEPVQEITKRPGVVKSKPTPNPLSIVGEIVERPERKIDPILTNKPPELKTQVSQTKKVHQKKQPAISAITIEVEKCLAEWFTIDTMMFLLGEEKVRELVTDKGECIKEYMSNYAQSIFYNSNNYDQYQALCRKLNMLELQDKKIDAKAKRELKPLPDYSILQEESKRMQLKVKAYLEGTMDIPEPTSTDPTETSEDAKVTQLPLVDKNAQNALRRKIVCQHLNKVLPDLLRSLGLSTFSVAAELKILVNTFKLSANNIMFKPIQWTLIAIIVLKLLSLRDKRLEYNLEQHTAFQHLQLLLLSYQQDGGYVDRLISWLTDIDRLLDNNDTQMTVN